MSTITAPATPGIPGLIKQLEKEIAARVDQAYANEGYVTTDGQRDPKKLQEAAYNVVIKCVVVSKADKATKAITKADLYAAVFPSGPGADGSGGPLDEYDEMVLSQLERDVWSLMQAKSGGAIQKRLGEESSTLVLLQATIRCPGKHLDKAPAVYLTDNPALIKEDGVDKEVKAFERKAENLRREMTMIIARHPELADQIKAELNHTLNRAQAELALPDTQQLQLQDGSDA